jgi:hypothetical protein
MRKIPTLFVRDPQDMRRVTREVHPACAWVVAGEGVATRKFDGTCVRLDESGEWYARREVKPGRTVPAEFVAVQTDEVTGKTVGWEPAEQSAFAKYLAEAVAALDPAQPLEPGSYELCGPKVNGNPEGYDSHVLVRHDGAQRLAGVPRDFDGLRGYLAEVRYEGIVWHHPDGRMAKLKVRDFPRP